MIVFTLIFAVSLAACSGKSAPSSSEEEPAPAPVPETETLVISNMDGYEQAGFTELHFTADKDLTLTRNDVSKSRGVEWTVYVLDEKFEDSYRYIPQAYERSVNGNGTVSVKAGQYLYVGCSENVFTKDPGDLTEGAEYIISYEKMPDEGLPIEPWNQTVIITNKDGFDQAGFVEIPFDTDKELIFVRNEESRNAYIEWTVYVMDEKFTDSFRYIPQAATPVLTGDGDVSVKAGQYVYIGCSENAFTKDRVELTDGARYSFSFEKLPGEKAPFSPVTETIVISNENGYDQAGFTELHFNKGAAVTFTESEESRNGSVEWNVYVMDEKFTDSFRYIPQAASPILTGSGTATVRPGQYVYVGCSENAFTKDLSLLTEGASYSLSFEKMPYEGSLIGPVVRTVVISNSDGYSDAGFVEVRFDRDTVVTFSANDASGNGGVVWSVYVMNDKFEDGYRYIPQAASAALKGDGTLSVKAGQYVYIGCSENANTTDKANLTDGAAYSYSYEE